MQERDCCYFWEHINGPHDPEQLVILQLQNLCENAHGFPPTMAATSSEQIVVTNLIVRRQNRCRKCSRKVSEKEENFPRFFPVRINTYDNGHVWEYAHPSRILTVRTSVSCVADLALTLAAESVTRHAVFAVARSPAVGAVHSSGTFYNNMNKTSSDL